jgi:hypothetical protein
MDDEKSEVEEPQQIEPGRPLNLRVAEVVFGRPPSYYSCQHISSSGQLTHPCSCPSLPSYSTNLNEVWPIVDSYKGHFTMERMGDEWFVSLDDFEKTAGQSKVPAEAICRAILDYLNRRGDHEQ